MVSQSHTFSPETMNNQYFDVLHKLEQTGHVNLTSETSAVTREAEGVTNVTQFCHKSVK